MIGLIFDEVNNIQKVYLFDLQKSFYCYGKIGEVGDYYDITLIRDGAKFVVAEGKFIQESPNKTFYKSLLNLPIVEHCEAPVVSIFKIIQDLEIKKTINTYRVIGITKTLRACILADS